MELGNSSKYCYENGVLKNKFDIQNREQLQTLERDITTLKISRLEMGEKVIDRFFDPGEYLKLHYYLFSSIYPFAGEVRDEVIHKSNEPYHTGKTVFCYPNFIYHSLSHYLSNMKADVVKIKSRDVLVRYLAYYYGELNMVHPFREGNGRTLRTYLELLVDYLSPYFSFGEVSICYSLWDEEDRKKLLEATISSSVTGEFQMIADCFDKVVVFGDKRRKSR